MAGGSDDERPKASPPIGTGGTCRKVSLAKEKAKAKALDVAMAGGRDDKGTGNATSRDDKGTGKATSRDDWNFFKYEDEKRRQDYTTRYGPIPDPRAHPQGIQDGYDAVYRVVERRGHHIWHDTDLTVYIIARREKPKSTNPDRTDKEKADKDEMDNEEEINLYSIEGRTTSTKESTTASRMPSRDDKVTGKATSRDDNGTGKATSFDDDAMGMDTDDDDTGGQWASGSKGKGDS
jgi:hypothetical protein